MLFAKMSIWLFLKTVMVVNGDDSRTMFDSFEAKIFSSTIDCRPSYQTTQDVKCVFHLKNNGQRTYSVLTWTTPLRGLQSSCLTRSRDGKELEYKGVFLKREDPGPEDFVFVGTGNTVSSTFDLSSAYHVTQAGTYTVAVDAILEYVEGSVSNLHKPGKPGIQTRIAHLASGYLPRSLKKLCLKNTG